jgi:peptide/nickel transport system permease protein
MKLLIPGSNTIANAGTFPMASRLASNIVWLRQLISFLRRLIRHPRGRFGLSMLVILGVIAWIGPLLLPESALDQDLNRVFQGPSAQHWLGTDHVGRDLFGRLAYGLQTTLSIAIASTGLAMVLGMTVGIVAGYVRGLCEMVLLRLIDVILAVPGLVLAFVVAAIMGAGEDAVIIALFIRAFPAFTRVSHSSTRKVMAQEFVQAGIVLGARPIRILLWYVVPHIIGSILVLWPIIIGIGILISSSLSFFGLGVQRPTAELGLLIADGRRFMYLHPTLLWLPGLVLIATNVSLSLLSDGLRIVLDPLQRDRSY